MPRLRPLPDLVRDSKIETTNLGDKRTRHVIFRAGRSARERRIRIEETWVRESCLGRGAYGTVYKEYKETNGAQEETAQGPGGESRPKVRAVKKINKSVIAGEEIDYTIELEAVAKFSNPKYSHCFVRSDGWYEIGDAIFISMEFIPHGDLQRQVETPLPESEVRDIASQLLEALEHMHENGFVHRDLKPGNIMVVQKSPDWWIKVADFGISKRRQQDVTSLHTMQRGTFGYAAPEALGHRGDAPYTSAVDIWSLGAVLFWLHTLTAVFPNFVEFCSYCSGAQQFPTDALATRAISRDGQQFVRSLMALEAKDRPSANAAAKHTWMTRPIVEGTGPAAALNIAPPGSTSWTAGGATISEASAAWSESNDTLSSRHQGETTKLVAKPRYRAPYVEGGEQDQGSSSRHQDQTIKPTPMPYHRAPFFEDEEVINDETSSVPEDNGVKPTTAGASGEDNTGKPDENDWRSHPVVFYDGRPIFPLSDVEPASPPGNSGPYNYMWNSNMPQPLRDAYSRRLYLVDRLKHLNDVRKAATLVVNPASPKPKIHDKKQLDDIITGVEEAIHVEDQNIRDYYRARDTPDETDTPSREEAMEILRRRYNGSAHPPPSSTGATTGGRKRAPRKQKRHPDFITVHRSSTEGDLGQTPTSTAASPLSSRYRAKPTPTRYEVR